MKVENGNGRMDGWENEREREKGLKYETDTSSGQLHKKLLNMGSKMRINRSFNINRHK